MILIAKGFVMRILFAFFLLISLAFPAYAAQETIAKAAIVIDTTTGAILMEKNATERMPTASMSKTMTAVVVFDALKRGALTLDSTCRVSEKAWKMQGSKMFVELGSDIRVEDLIKGVIIQSGNDATIVLAECVAGSEERFAGLMNEMAARFGMTGSHFMNASGWPDPDHYSTPRDLALLAWRLVTDYADYYKYDAIREFEWHGITQQNRNPLLGKVEGADGIKTGHTEEAGYGLIGSAKRNNRRVIMVISGLNSDKDREAEGIRLMNWALDSFSVKKLLTAGTIVARAPVVYGAAREVDLVIAKDVVSTVPATYNPKDLQLKVKYQTPQIAPIAKGTQIGTIEVTLPEMASVQTYPLLAGSDVARKGFISLTFEKIIQAAK